MSGVRVSESSQIAILEVGWQGKVIAAEEVHMPIEER